MDESTKRHIVVGVVGLTIIGLAGWQLGIFQDDVSGTVQAVRFDPGLIERGREIFVAHECTTCHGEDAQGTDIAPALPGHTDFMVRRQVRAPMGIMPVYSPNDISADELTALSAYITTLEGTHIHDAGSRADESLLHHQLALAALRAGDAEEAQYQVEQILPLVASEHLELMETVRDLIVVRNLSEAELLISNMLRGVPDDGSTPFELALQLVLIALRNDAPQQIVNHLEHVITLAEDAEDLELIENLQLLIDVGAFHDAEHRIEERVGITFLSVGEQGEHTHD